MNKRASEQGTKGRGLQPYLFFACSLLLLLALAGCAIPQIATSPAFDFTKVKRISVSTFEGPGGQVATDEFVKKLIGSGIEVTDAHHPGDVILVGFVTEYKTNAQLMVFLGENNPIVAPGAQETPEGVALAIHKAQVASVMAAAGIQARLLEVSSKRIVWADSYSYEGLDLPYALESVVDALTRSMARTLPQLHPHKPS